MKSCSHEPLRDATRMAARRAAVAFAGTLLVVTVVWSAILAKEARRAPALIDVSRVGLVKDEPQGGPVDIDEVFDTNPTIPATPTENVIDATIMPVGMPAAEVPDSSQALSPELQKLCSDPAVRWFNGRPAKPARVMTMTVTAYSPDEKSCGKFADGVTATLHSVETNNFHLVAADPTLLPYGSILSIPGYADQQMVPVLDCGGAIKGRHIDLLFPTDAEARAWGVKKLRVTVWQYVDGLPAGNPRKER